MISSIFRSIAGGERRNPGRQCLQLPYGDGKARLLPATLGGSAAWSLTSRRAPQSLGSHRVDAEVLFPNGPGGTFFY